MPFGRRRALTTLAPFGWQCHDVTVGPDIRQFAQCDAEQWVALMTSAFAMPRGPVVRSLEMAPPPGQTLVRLVAVDGAVVVGLAEADGEAPIPGRALGVRVAVSEACRGRGIGRTLTAKIGLGASGRRQVATTVRDDDPRSRQFAERLGFEVVEHSEGWILDLDQAPVRRPPPESFAVVALGPDPGDDGWRHAYRFFIACCADTPDLHGDVPPFDAWHRLVGFPAGAVLATMAGEPAGCSFAVPESDDTWRIAMTGVAPFHRGAGVGAAVKAALEGRAREAGIRYLRTNSLAGNQPIRALNRALGYRGAVGIYRMRREPSATAGGLRDNPDPAQR